MKILLFFVLLISTCSPSSCVTVNRINQIENTYILKDGDFVDSLKAYRSVAALSVDDLKGSPTIMASGFAISNKYIISAGHFCVGVYEGNNKGQLKEKINMV